MRDCVEDVQVLINFVSASDGIPRASDEMTLDTQQRNSRYTCVLDVTDVYVRNERDKW